MSNRHDALEALSFLQASSLPEAHAEVQAVVSATSDAASKILDAAEKIQDIAKTLEHTGSSRELLEAVTSIFEASIFHDITGQRLKKITQALGAVDTGIAALLENGGSALPPIARTVSVDDPASLLNGPALPDEAPSQDDIDRLFSA